MSVDPDHVDKLARAAVGVAQDAEQAIVQRVASALSRGIDSPDWQRAKLADLARQRAAWERIVEVYLRSGRTAVGAAVLEGGARGQALALTALRAAFGAAAPGSLAGSRSVLALAAESAGIVTSTRFGILRAAEDLYRGTVEGAVGRVLLGGETRRGVAQTVLDRLLGNGLTGFVDKAGRRWELASYVEMATRTAVQRAMTQAHTEALQEQGLDLIIVSDAPQECERCRPWEGKVLSLSGGGAGTVQVASVTNPDRLVSVTVAGSLEQAKRAGLLHPGCRHSYSAYLPGLTKRPTSTADPEGDAARQRLRELERRVRREKLREAAALGPSEAARARGRVRQGQAAIREHVERTGMIRQPAREVIGKAR
jgi:hypothetical protein